MSEPSRHALTPPRTHRRDTLTDQAAGGAVWYTRYTCAAVDVVYGLGFVLGAPLNSSTYRAMETVLPMWAWGAALVTAGLVIALWRVLPGAAVGLVAWLCFAAFNVASGAWGAPLFGGWAWLHIGMLWFVIRGVRAAPGS